SPSANVTPAQAAELRYAQAGRVQQPGDRSIARIDDREHLEDIGFLEDSTGERRGCAREAERRADVVAQVAGAMTKAEQALDRRQRPGATGSRSPGRAERVRKPLKVAKGHRAKRLADGAAKRACVRLVGPHRVRAAAVEPARDEQLVRVRASHRPP